LDFLLRSSMLGRLTFSPSSFKKGLHMRNNLPKGDFSENHHCGRGPSGIQYCPETL
jgi:hypothetical protein